MIALFGSGEFQDWAEPVDRQLLEAAANRSDRVLILATASAPEGDEVFDRWGRMGTDHYRKIGANPHVVPLKTRDDAFRPEIVDQVDGAAMIFFSGGNPGYAANTLKDTPFWEAVVDALREGASFGGCSAGAGMLGARAPDVTSDSVLNFRNMAWVEGLKLYPSLLIGAHWDALDSYIPGLVDYLIGLIPKDQVLLAIDENTAVIGRAGSWTVEGRGGATIIKPDAQPSPFGSGSTFHLPEASEVLG